MRHIILISGKDSLATALFQTAHEPRDDYEYLFNDTGCELPETYAWLEKVEQQTGWHLQRIGKDLQEAVVLRNGFLPSSRQRYCTRETKIEPMKAFLAGDEATIYYGLRADEKRTGYVPVASDRITPRYPLRENGLGLPHVLAINAAQGLTPPSFFWRRLYDAVVETMLADRLVFEDWHQWISPIEYDFLFAGRSRSNCFLCFFQRQYEWIWLAETHPDLFAAAAGMEHVGSNYTWRNDYSLPALLERKHVIFGKRVRQVVEYIERKRFNPVPLDEDEIAAFSCGLLCGK